MGEKTWRMREVHNGEASDDDVVNGSASRLSEEPCDEEGGCQCCAAG